MNYVQMLKHEIEADNTIIISLAEIKILCNKKAKRLNTDRACEQQTKEIQAFIDSNDTTTTQTAPNASQSNAFAERRFKKLMVTTWTEMTASPHIPKHLWSFAVLDAADKVNYLAEAKEEKPQKIPNTSIKNVCSQANILIPETA